MILVIGHLISVKEGRADGMSDAQLFADENLATFCEEDNAGQGAVSINIQFMARLQRIWQTRPKL